MVFLFLSLLLLLLGAIDHPESDPHRAEGGHCVGGEGQGYEEGGGGLQGGGGGGAKEQDGCGVLKVNCN